MADSLNPSLNPKENLKEAIRIPDQFEIEAINLMVYLITTGGLEVDKNDTVLEFLNKLSLQYNQATEKITVLQDHVNIDPRTGLLRYQDIYFKNIFKNISRIFSGYNNETEYFHLSYIRMDIDDFSKFNNLYGHELGDEVLKKVGEEVNGCARPTDFAIRYGGEELDLILTTCPPPGAAKVMTRLFENLKNVFVEHEGKKIPITLSAGISHLALPFKEIIEISKDMSKTDLMHKAIQKEADDSLYEAKLLGKNRFCFYDKAKKDDYPTIRTKYQESKHKK